MSDGDRAVLKIGAALLLLVLLATVNCASHMESKLDLTRERTVTEPVAVPQHARIRGWSIRPVVPNAGGRLSPPGVTPLPEIPFVMGADGSVEAYFDADIDYGPPQTKTTTVGEKVKAEGESDKKPQIPSLLGMVLGNWKWGALGLVAIVIAALLFFRKSPAIARLLKLAPFPISLLAPKE